MDPPLSQVEIEGMETDLPFHMNIAIMATLNVVRLTSRLLLPSKPGCRLVLYSFLFSEFSSFVNRK